MGKNFESRSEDSIDQVLNGLRAIAAGEYQYRLLTNDKTDKFILEKQVRLSFITTITTTATGRKRRFRIKRAKHW